MDGDGFPYCALCGILRFAFVLSYQLVLLGDEVRYLPIPKLLFPTALYSFIDIERLAVANIQLNIVGRLWVEVLVSRGRPGRRALDWLNNIVVIFYFFSV
jgi:hypothetical protein